MKEVDYKELLGRKPIEVKMDEIYAFLKGKVILVTGGGGSIGSELCRQIAAHEPKQLIIFDIYENNAFAIQQELIGKYPNLDLRVIIGSVRDSRRINQVFATYKPEITYHAAAHKHVPLMEISPSEAIKNNAIGTYKTAYAAMCNGCKRFVLISSDKAVNPTNVMGASKRICELIIQAFAKKISNGTAHEIKPLHVHYEDSSGTMLNLGERVKKPETEFVAVRFGNVLGSNGSVIPTFMKQIEEGKNVTVTDPRITRYFMLIPEAVSLVLEAGLYAKGGEIFVFDMGEPVKILDLAKKLIEMYGDKDKDIQIEFTGLRPGEKLYEETLMEEEGLVKTANNLIYVGAPLKFNYNKFLERMQDLMESVYDYHGDNDEENNREIRRIVKKIVKTYKPQQNQRKSQCDEELEQAVEEVESEEQEKTVVCC